MDVDKDLAKRFTATMIGTYVNNRFMEIYLQVSKNMVFTIIERNSRHSFCEKENIITVFFYQWEHL